MKLWSKNEINAVKPKLVDRVTAYRAGYRSEERREIEEGLKSRKYLGVTCTNALELGINIGSLDAVIISGYPGTMVSVWQQSGRAGRSNQKSLAILVAFENQLDQYFMNNPDFFFDKPHENVFIDLNNSILRNAHILCAANECFLSADDSKKYFDTSVEVLDNLVEKEYLKKRSDEKYAYSGDDNPAFNHSLNQLSNEEFRVFYNRQVLETMERSQVYREAHEGAVLINKGESYIVKKLNLKNKSVNVVKEDVDYHTLVLNNVDVNIKRKISKTKFGNLTIYFGELTVTEDYYKYKKMQFSKTVGSFDLDLPPLKFTTKGLWFTIPNYLKEDIEDAYDGESIFEGGLHGAEHALIGLFPLHVMCDRSDIGGLSTTYHEDTQESTIFIYDGYEGGIGITEKAIEVFPELVKSTYDLLKNCDCVDGCPACIYSPKCGNDNKPLHKKATKHILGYMCNKIECSNSEAKEEHEKMIDDVIVDKKDSFEVEYEEAYDLYCQGDYLTSRDILDDILSKDKKNSDAWALIAMILYEQGDKQGAINFNKKALKYDSANEQANELSLKLNNL